MNIVAAALSAGVFIVVGGTAFAATPTPTPSGMPVPGPTPALAPPTNVQFDAHAGGGATVTWEDRAQGEEGYRVIIYLNGSPRVFNLPANSTQLEVPDFQLDCSGPPVGGFLPGGSIEIMVQAFRGNAGSATRLGIAYDCPSAAPTGSMTIRGQVPVRVGSTVMVESLDIEHIKSVPCASTITTGSDASNPSHFIVVVTRECTRPPGSAILRICWATDVCSVLDFKPGDVDVGLLSTLPASTSLPGAGDTGPDLAPPPQSLPNTGGTVMPDSTPRFGAALAGILALVGLIATTSGVRRITREE